MNDVGVIGVGRVEKCMVELGLEYIGTIFWVEIVV